VIGRRLGLSFDDGAIAMLNDALSRRAGRARLLPSQYVGHLENGGADDELRALALELTTTETYFFRHEEQLEAFCGVVAREHAPASHALRVLSAGCASGEEPYSLAILLKERFLEVAAATTLVGVDVNARALEAAARGRYTAWSLRKTTDDLVQRWFHKEKGEHVLAPTLRSMVRFERRNLVDEDSAFFRPGAFDAIFCRNVLMYFTAEAAQAVVRRLAQSLTTGGVLFVGHAETWRVDCPELELCRTHDTFYYRRRDPAAACDARAELRGLDATAIEPGGWTAAISRSADRVASLIERAAVSVPASETSTDETSGVRRVPEDETSAGARYLLALCKESEGDRRGAKEQAVLAVQADPTFSLPHLYLGLLLRREGEVQQARRRLEQALALLEREDPSRLQVYGDGFSRDALIALCRSELSFCEGRT
jgi:chemotaxis protein methyltransferase CheR